MYIDPYSGGPYWSIIPPIFDNWPYETWIGDFPPIRPRDKKEEENYQKGWIKAIEKLQNPVSTTTSDSNADKKVWFNDLDGNQVFCLEVVGYGKEHISAEIKNNVLYVSGKNRKFFNHQFSIPSPESLDFEKISVKVEHGLLEIVFPVKKKEEAKGIKIL